MCDSQLMITTAVELKFGTVVKPVCQHPRKYITLLAHFKHYFEKTELSEKKKQIMFSYQMFIKIKINLLLLLYYYFDNLTTKPSVHSMHRGAYM